MKKLELLAPAGSLEICKAVIDNGADAVYLGGNLFGARAYAKNFDQEQLFEAMDYAHLFDKKIFLTVNTLLKNEELEKNLYHYIAPLYEHGLDAAIVQDFGVLQFLHRYFPDLPLHASTQMSITNAYGAGWLKEQGVSRIVTAREVSLQEIRALYDATGMEIESFVHGALCYCYSGQCLLSSLLGGRSGNRGRCAQPCRLPYEVVDAKGSIYNKNERYPLSPKDLCTIDFLPQMAEAGVYSYKIEGRMKQLEYASGVTAIYRKYMDYYESGKEYRVSQEDRQALLDLGSRNGFTKGYYYDRNDKSLLSLTTSAHKSGEGRPDLIPAAPALPITMESMLYIGAPAVLTVRQGCREVTIEGTTVMEAVKQPLQQQDVIERLKKTGDTVFSVEDISVDLSENAFLPVKAINELRREALRQLESQILNPYKRAIRKDKATMQEQFTYALHHSDIQHISVLVRTNEQLQTVLAYDYVDRIMLDSAMSGNWEHNVSLIHKSGKMAVLAMPAVVRKNSLEYYQTQCKTIVSAGFDAVLVRTHDGIGLAKKLFPNLPLIADHGLYTYSDYAIYGFASNGVTQNTAPYELNEGELRHRDNSSSELIVYGWIPVMYTAQCVYKNFAQCHRDKDSKQVLFLKDRYQKQFPVACDCLHCYNTIYNTQPTMLFGQLSKIKNLGMAGLRLEFLQESEREVRGVLKEFYNVYFEGMRPDMTKWENQFTNGHFKRGIE